MMSAADAATRTINAIREQVKKVNIDNLIAEAADKAPFTCRYCGSSSWLDPVDQTAPPDYCHESDHGNPDEPAASTGESGNP